MLTEQIAELSRRPLRLCSNRVWRTYAGGLSLEQWQGREDAADGDFPEEWVASCVKASNVGREHIEEGLSRVRLEDGSEVALKALVEAAPEAFLGESHAAQYGSHPAVLVKVLDAGERLTIQVHPDRTFAMERFHSRFGKTEAWYVLGGRAVDGEEPYLLFGFKPGMTRARWRELFERQDIPGMLDALHRVPLREGEVFLIEGGVPHAIGSGCFLIEVQEPTDYTLRTERTTPRGMAVPDRACHQGLGFESMLDCFHYEAYSYEETMARWKKAPRLAQRSEGGEEHELIAESDTDRFRMRLLHVRSRYKPREIEGFGTAIVLQGEGKLHFLGGVLEASQSDQFFIPAGTKEVEWESTGTEALKVVLCHPPR